MKVQAPIQTCTNALHADYVVYESLGCCPLHFVGGGGVFGWKVEETMVACRLILKESLVI